MPNTDILLDDIQSMIKDLKRHIVLLSRLYYDPEFSTIFNRLAVTMSKQAAEFIIESMGIEAKKYADRKGFEWDE